MKVWMQKELYNKYHQQIRTLLCMTSYEEDFRQEMDVSVRGTLHQDTSIILDQQAYPSSHATKDIGFGMRV